MPDLEDQDPPEFRNHVNRRVTIEMLDTEELVQELIDRNNLVVITARRRVPRTLYSNPKFYPAVQALLSCDLAKVLVSENMIGEDVIQFKDDLEFRAAIMVLRTIEEEIPV